MNILDDLCELIVDCEHKTAPIQEEGIPSIRTPNIGRGYFIIDGVNRVSEATYDSWTRRAVPEAGDLILAREAPVGNVAVIPTGLKCCLGQRTVLMRPKEKDIDSDYLCYLLLTPALQADLLGKSSGATVHHLNLKDIRALPIPQLPTLDDQKAKALIIRAYDDLIETNRRRIALLEESARLLYREWFVNLRFPGHELAMQSGGILHFGWIQQPVGEWLEHHIGGGWGVDVQTAGAAESAYVIRGTDITKIRAGSFEGVPLRFHPEKNLLSRRLRPGDLVFEVSGGSRDQGVGRLLNISEELLSAFDAPVICASFCKLLRPKPGLSILLSQTLDYLRASLVLRSFENQSASNIVNFAFSDFVVRHLVWLPPPNLVDAFNEKACPIFQQLDVLATIQKRLSTARDDLLPRLMSGQIQV